MIWDDATETVIFRDPSSHDLGTIFVHDPMKTKEIFVDYINKQF
jgi:hypothetical protein